jgi:hypothetical protein
VAGRFFDQVILVFGVNDTTSLRSLERWRADCAALIDGFQAAGAQVTCTAVPPLQHFSALPGLLRALLGWRGRLLDEAGERCAISLARPAPATARSRWTCFRATWPSTAFIRRSWATRSGPGPSPTGWRRGRRAASR